MSFNVRDALDDRGGHLIPDYELWDVYADETTDEDREFFAQENDSDARFEQGQYDEGDGVATKLYGAPELVEESDA